MTDLSTASAEIDAIIASLGDWRGDTLSRIRALIHDAVPDVVETVKWKKPTNPAGVPCWEKGGIICTGETYRDKVKLTFPKGYEIPDPMGLFNAGLTGVRRAIDLREGDELDEAAFLTLLHSC